VAEKRAIRAERLGPMGCMSNSRPQLTVTYLLVAVQFKECMRAIEETWSGEIFSGCTAISTPAHRISGFLSTAVLRFPEAAPIAESQATSPQRSVTVRSQETVPSS
jgi:hypothetical protein